MKIKKRKKSKAFLPPFGWVDYEKNGEVHTFTEPAKKGRKKKDVRFTAEYINGMITISPVLEGQTFYIKCDQPIKAVKKKNK